MIFGMQEDVRVKAQYVDGVKNGPADALSRMNFNSFLQQVPAADPVGTPIPLSLWHHCIERLKD